MMKDMVIQRYLLLIIVLCCADVECVERLQRAIETIDLNTLSEDFTDEERGVRSLLKSKHRLRTGDAEKVAQYFINGGPMAGHSHFVKAFNTAAFDYAINSLSGMNNNEIKLESEFLNLPIINIDSRSSWNSPLSMVPEVASPSLPDVETYGTTNHPIFGYPTTNGFYDLMSHHFHQSPLLRAVSLPRRILHNLIGYHVYHYHHHPLYYRRNVNMRNNTNNQDTVSNLMSNNSQNDTEIPRISDANTTHKPIQYHQFEYYYTPYINPFMNLYPQNTKYYPLPMPHMPLIPYPIVSSHQQNTSKQPKIPTTTTETADKIYDIDKTKNKNQN